MELLTSTLISAAIIIVPGPNVLVIVSTSITQGLIRGLQTVAGTSLAMIVQLGIAALTTSSLVTVLSQGLVWLKWAGVFYLCYLGIRQLLDLRRREPMPSTALGSFQRGFWVSLTNPKTIIFFAAFLPQFVSATAAYLPQVLVLSTVFLLMASLLDSCYAVLAGKLAVVFSNDKLFKFQQGFGGLLFLGAGAGLAASRSS
jgi:homoserine/homoserine lactone efflux protein